MHTVNVRLTVDIIPDIKVIVFREGESPDNYMVDAEVLAARAETDQVSIDEVIEEIQEEEQAADEETMEEPEEMAADEPVTEQVEETTVESEAEETE
jgi:hypothetical protein